MIWVIGPLSLRISASVPAAMIFPLAMAKALTLAGIAEGSSAWRWVPVRMLPWRKTASAVWAWAAAEAASRMARVRVFTDGSVSGRLPLWPVSRKVFQLQGLGVDLLCKVLI